MMQILEAATLSKRRDRGIWKMGINGIFSINSLLKDLQQASTESSPQLYELIWKSHIPKMIKFLLWKLSHKAINTNDKLQRRPPHWNLSHQWCTICKNSLLDIFGIHIQASFHWHMALPRDPKMHLAYTLGCHPFKKKKKFPS